MDIQNIVTKKQPLFLTESICLRSIGSVVSESEFADTCLLQDFDAIIDIEHTTATQDMSD